MRENSKYKFLGMVLMLASCLWLAACFFVPEYGNPGSLTRNIWHMTSFFIPAFFALSGALLQPPYLQNAAPNRAYTFVITSCVVLNFLLTYLVFFLVIDGMFEVWRRMSYEGGISLNFYGALFLAMVWAALLSTTGVYLRRKAVLKPSADFLNRAALSLLLVAPALGLIFFIHHISYITWRF